MTLTTIFMMPENSIIAEKLKTIFAKPDSCSDDWVKYCSRGLQLRQRIEAVIIRLCRDYGGIRPEGKDGADGAGRECVAVVAEGRY